MDTLTEKVESQVNLALKKPERLKPLLPALVTVSASDLSTAKLPPRDLILSPWLPEKGLAMVYGARGVGKTHLVMGCAWAIAEGGTFLNWSALRPRKVLIIDGEMPQQLLQERLVGIMKGLNVSAAPDFLRFLPMDMQERGLDLSNEDHQLELEVLIDDTEVIIVDNISTLARGGKENEGESWLPIQYWALSQRRAGRSVIFVHHAGKGGQQRGTSRREDVLDTVIALRTPQDHSAEQGARFEVHFEKNRGFYGDKAQAFEAELGATGWTIKNIEDAPMDRVIKLTEGGLSVRQIEAETSMSKSTINRMQGKARDAGRLKIQSEPEEVPGND